MQIVRVLCCWRRRLGDMMQRDVMIWNLNQGKPDQARDVLKQGLGSEDPSGADAGRSTSAAVFTALM